MFKEFLKRERERETPRIIISGFIEYCKNANHVIMQKRLSCAVHIVQQNFEPKLVSLFLEIKKYFNPVANLIKHFTIVNYNARVVLTTNLPILRL